MIDPLEVAAYEDVRAAFRWPQVARCNIADMVSTRWARTAPERPAIIELGAGDERRVWSFGELDRAANRLANLFAAKGVGFGDRVAILAPQRVETALAHIALYKLGAQALPLFTLFGADGLALRLGDARAVGIVVDAANLPKLAEIGDAAESLRFTLCVDGPGDGAEAFWPGLEAASDHRETAATGPMDPAILCYTSGTTGPPKGASHGHQILMGHQPGVQMWLDGFPKPGDVAWTPADWAWLGGLCNVLLPSLAAGVPVVAHRMARFDPERAYWIWREFEVTVGFMPPTALRLMRSHGAPEPRPSRLRAIGCGGEPLGVELLDWGRSALGLVINEFYGQTECNLVTANSAARMPVKPGSIGRATPGFDVAAVDEAGRVVPAEAVGEIAVRRPNPAMFLGYLNRPEATAAKFVGDWMLTGDRGWIDDEGYVFFQARADDVISSAGYRIGPSEVEDCLIGHPAVAAAGVIGVPDPVRGEAVKAYVCLRDPAARSPALAAEIQEHVRRRLSGHAYPREIAFLDSLPTTATGKILRRELKRMHADERDGDPAGSS